MPPCGPELHSNIKYLMYISTSHPHPLEFSHAILTFTKTSIGILLMVGAVLYQLADQISTWGDIQRMNFSKDPLQN